MKSLLSLIFILVVAMSSAQVDLVLEKNLLTPPPYQFGSNLAYELKIRNNGSIPVTNISLRETLPCGLTFSSSNATWTPSGSDLITTLTSTLNAGASTSVFIDFNLIGCNTLGAWANTATILSFTDTGGNNLTDPNTSNNTDVAEASIYDLALTNKMITTQPYGYNSNITFEIEVFNQGNKPVNNVVIRDFVPTSSGLVFESASNPSWTISGTQVSRTITSTILPGQSAKVTLILKLVRATGGVRTWSNYAEIRFAEDTMGSLIFDADSTLGSNSISENSILAGSPQDNNVLVRGPLFGEDEDDHDPAAAMVFDLALTKRQQTALESFSYIQNVPYIFTITNQGNTAATNIVVGDYLSDALSYVNSPLNMLRGWTFNSSTRIATRTLSGILQPGTQDTFILDLKPNQFYSDYNNAWTDFGEIIQAEDTDPATSGSNLDIDSTPDNIKDNDAGASSDTPSDNAIDGDGTGTFGSTSAATDEDDHDVHKIEIVDLALTKMIDPPAPYYAPNQNVRFALKIYNQGNVPLKNIVLVDSIGSGFGFTPGGVNNGWTGSLPKLSRIMPAILLPGEDTTLYITLTILSGADLDEYINYAEVAAAQDTFNFNRNDDADSVYDNFLFNDNQVLPNSTDDNNVLGDANLGQDEDDHDVAAIPSIICPKPTLTIGNPICQIGSNTYSLTFYSSATNITSSLGTVSGLKINNIPFGSPVVITATSPSGCETILNFPGYSSCENQNECSYPQLTVGQPICNGSSYSVSFTHDFGLMSVSAGNIIGNTVVNIPVGQNLIISSTNGSCSTRINVNAPEDCTIPCVNPPVSISGPICDSQGTGFYSINFTTIPNTVITSSIGTISGNSIINIPVTSTTTITASVEGCDNHVINVPLPECPPCEKPTLTIGLLECNPGNNTYSMSYYTSVVNNNNISVSAGTKSGSNRVINIPLGTPVTITARVGGSCVTTLTTPGLSSCPPSTCVTPKLTVGQPICNGTFYSVSFSVDQGVVSSSAGTIAGNTITNIPLGSNITVSATNGACVASVGVARPINCSTPCENPPISISGPICELESNGTFSLRYTTLPGVFVDISSGIVGNGIITNIPSNIPSVLLTASLDGCSEKQVIIPSITCPICEKPNLTIGLPECNPANNTYSIKYYSNVNTITSSIGNVSNGTISNIPLGSGVTVTATSSVQCTTSLSMPALQQCPPSTCDLPKLTVGQPICNGNTYTVSFTNDVGSVTSTAGTIVGNTITNIGIGTNITITATNGQCVSRISISSPTSCSVPCVNPSISISGPICEGETVNTYSINYIALSGTQVLSSIGTVGNGIITGIPSNTNASLTINNGTCTQRVVTVPAINCVSTGMVTSFVWHDFNGDGIQGANEPGLPGVLVTIKQENGMTVAMDFSDQNGNVSFTVPEGNYYLVYGETGEFTTTYPNQGNDNTDSDLDLSNGAGSTQTFTVLSGQTVSIVDAGFYICVPIGELVWYDTNKNNLKDENENGINGIRVELWQRWQNNWVFHSHTITRHKPGTGSTDGYFKFCVAPGQYYVKVIMPPLGLVPALANQGNNELKDSDIGNNFGPGTTTSFTLVSGQMKCDIGAGFHPMVTVSSIVWLDDNVNGIRESNEGRLAGVLVEAIESATGDVAQVATTNQNGEYFLDYMQQQNYYLRFSPPNNYVATIPLQGNNDEYDSNVNHQHGNNTTSDFPSVSGQAIVGIDMGVVFAPLPVTWTSIDAINNKTYHLISWVVGIEKNVLGYQVERSFDGIDWEDIGDIIQAKNLDVNHRYNASDSDISKTGDYYYRVVATDFDGRLSKSSVVKVTREAGLRQHLYPNPSSGPVFIEISVDENSEVQAHIYDQKGKWISEVLSNRNLAPGLHQLQFDLNKLANGTYNLVLKVNGESNTYSIIKVK
jgi:uncharacterized repeat protein (TIGR01451 family)